MSELRWFRHLIWIPPGHLTLEVFEASPTGRRPGIPQNELENVAGEREAWVGLLDLLSRRPDPGLCGWKWMNGLSFSKAFKNCDRTLTLILSPGEFKLSSWFWRSMLTRESGCSTKVYIFVCSSDSRVQRKTQQYCANCLSSCVYTLLPWKRTYVGEPDYMCIEYFADRNTVYTVERQIFPFLQLMCM